MSENAVVFCVTRLHLQLTAVAITSILENYQNNQPLQILVVCEDVQQPDIDYIKTLPQKFGLPQVTVDFWSKPSEVDQISPDFTIGEGVPVPPMAIWRLFTPNYFANYQKLLYLDNDVIVKTDVSRLFDLLDEHHVLAAVPDFLFAASKNYYEDQYPAEELYGMKSMRHYFNNGMMIINTAQFNQMIPVDKLITTINTTHWHLADQTILNILLEGHVQLLPWRFNYQHDLTYLHNPDYHWDPQLVQKIIDDYPRIVIRHFAGSGFLALPYEHVQVSDEWDLEFWRLLEKVKKASRVSRPSQD